MREKTITKDDFITTKWAGGETIQLAIYPEDAVFADRDFLWRISSATFTGTESTFSDFSGYQRYLLPLEGGLSVSHKGLYSRKLEKYDVEYFDGSWETTSENSLDCRDYNFIVRSCRRSKLQVLHEGDEIRLKSNEIVTLFSAEDYEIELGIEGGTRSIKGFNLYIMEIEQDIKLRMTSASEPAILTEFQNDK